ITLSSSTRPFSRRTFSLWAPTWYSLIASGSRAEMNRPFNTGCPSGAKVFSRVLNEAAILSAGYRMLFMTTLSGIVADGTTMTWRPFRVSWRMADWFTLVLTFTRTFFIERSFHYWLAAL